MRVQVLADIPRLQDERFSPTRCRCRCKTGVMPGKEY